MVKNAMKKPKVKKPLKVKYIPFVGAFFVINAKSVEILRLSRVY